MLKKFANFVYVAAIYTLRIGIQTVCTYNKIVPMVWVAAALETHWHEHLC